MSSFIPRNLTEIEAITGCTFACICNTVFRMFSCLQINCQPFYLRQLLKFHQFDWLIEIYLQTEGQGTHHKMVSLQPMSGFSPLFAATLSLYYKTRAHRALTSVQTRLPLVILIHYPFVRLFTAHFIPISLYPYEGATNSHTTILCGGMAPTGLLLSSSSL